MNLFLLLKFLHVLCVVLAVGLNLSYGFWQAQARKNPPDLLFVLKKIRMLDRYFANTGYAGAVLTGLGMVWVGGYSLKAFWIWMSVAILALIAILGITVYSPLLKKQIQALEMKGIESQEYITLESRSNQIGIGLYFLVAVILFLMVTKVQF